MALDPDLAHAKTRRPSGSRLPLKAPICVLVAVAIAPTLAGCNASQGVDLSSQTTPGVRSGREFPNYNPYNPVSYGQTSGFYAGR